ncbi:MAG: ribonuclease domain-containing protein [Nocardioides sp.]|uniref:ribonuclease domain-containing protein n=1 Tax=Nocardioides sp. TaxID=35761 RepID=UPI003F07AFE3
MARDNGRTPASLGALVVVLLIAVLYWWVESEGQGEDTAKEPASKQTSSHTLAPAPETTEPSATTTSDSEQPSEQPDATDDQVPDVDPASGLPVVLEEALPAEAGEVLDDIDAGGPYEYDRDGITFGNYEGILPDEQRGYYREYTVETPGLSHRGARRIVVGGGRLFYWTDDHYESFSRIWR